MSTTDDAHVRRRDFLRGLAAVAPLVCAPWLFASEAAKRRPNLLFIMTDQQRFDALSCAGNPVIKTPNLDRLAREGAWFKSAYTTCPVCAPARTSILTGRNVDSTSVRENKDAHSKGTPDLLTFDQVLARNGYGAEYYGKWHSLAGFAREYDTAKRWGGEEASAWETRAYAEYVKSHVPNRELEPGECRSKYGGCPYRPDPLDTHCLSARWETGKARGAAKAQKNSEKGAQLYGCLDMPAEHSRTAYTAREGIEALDRLKDGPFSLTVSIIAPHPPMIVPTAYYGRCPAESIPIPASIEDPRANSPYPAANGDATNPYRDPRMIQQMASDYYGLITEVDDWVGKILQRLDELNLADHTMVIFTSDHGEMLGDHGLHSKIKFYEGSVHIPLLMRLPGIIPAGTVVTAPVSHLDMFATILDYLGVRAPESDGASLRPLVEGKDSGAGRFVVSEEPGRTVESFMAFDGRWKLIFGAGPDTLLLDGLYDLQADPHEMNNLIGANPDREKHRGEAERMKALLVGWLERVKSPHAEGVKARRVIDAVSWDALTAKRRKAQDENAEGDDE